MSTIKRILFPINGDPYAVEYAMDMAQRSNAKLYLLKTYRLVEEMRKHQSENKSLKLSIEETIEKDFYQNYRNILNKWSLDYELLIEVGFFVDRIITNIQQKNIDILLLDDVRKGAEENLIDRLEEMKVPVLFIPQLPEEQPFAL